MCDRMHFEDLEQKVEEVKDTVSEVKTDMTAYHNRTDERLKTLFSSVDRLSSSATSLVRILTASLVFIVTVAVLALVYGAIGQSGFNAVTRATAVSLSAQKELERLTNDVETVKIYFRPQGGR